MRELEFGTIMTNVSLSSLLPLFLSQARLSTGIGCAGRCIGVTLIVVALRRRAVVTLYSPFAQLRELKLLDRHCTPTIEVILLILWLIIAIRNFVFFSFCFTYVFHSVLQQG